MKEILVFADGAEDAARARIQLAWSIAKEKGAHLEALRPVPLPAEPYGLVTPSLEHVYREIVAGDQAKANGFLETLGAIAPLGEHFSAYAPGLPFGRVRAAAAAAARMSDLVVLGQPESTDNTSLDIEILLGALFGSGAPCLLFPRWITPHAWGRRAVVAWKGTPEAGRALRAAMPFLQQAESVHLILVDPRSEWEGEDQRSIQRLATYIARHGVRIEEPVIVRSGGLEYGVEDAIASELERFGADFLVMGAYGHARWTELAFGGVSRRMIKSASMPILLTH